MLDTTSGQCGETLPTERPAVLCAYWLVDGPAWQGARVMYDLDGVSHCDLIELRDDGFLYAMFGEVPNDIAEDVGNALLRWNRSSSLYRGTETGEDARTAYDDFYDRDIGPDPVLGEAR